MISVVINNHNYGRYIAEAMDSVLAQTYRDFELIVVDGASTDNSRDVIHSYVSRHPERITAVFKPSSGQGAAFNLGYALAKGDVIAMLDSDDYWFPNKLETVAEAHGKHGAVAHFFVRSNWNGGLRYSPAELEVLNRARHFLHKYGTCCTGGVTTSTLSISRELCARVFPIPEAPFMTFADSYVMLQLCYYDRIQFLPDELSYYRIHGKNEFVGNSAGGQKRLVDLLRNNANLFNQKLLCEGRPPLPEFDRRRYHEFLRENGVDIVSGETYALYGAGQLGAEMKRVCEAYGARVLCFCDSDAGRHGQEFCGVPVISPGELAERRGEYAKIFVASAFFKEIEATLRGMSLEPEKDYCVRNFIVGYPMPEA